MPAKSEAARARRRARDLERKRERRAELTAYERERRSKIQTVKKVKKPEKTLRLKANERPFVGVDGEGYGKPRNAYALFRIGERELWKGGDRLTTPEILDFILAEPRETIMVCFGLDYDTTMLLDDVREPDVERERRARARGDNVRPAGRIASLLRLGDDGLERDSFRHPFTFLDFDGWHPFGVKYLKTQFLTVARLDRQGRAVRGSSRTIYEVRQNFGSTFTAALADFNMSDRLDDIERMKGERENFTRRDFTHGDVRAYNERECHLLAELMEEYRRQAFAGDIKPRTWNGPGKLAAASHKAHGTPARAFIERRFKTQGSLLKFADFAYYGGRFETPTIGDLGPGPFYDYDISSAYPANMIDLPCLVHGKWRWTEAPELRRQLNRDPDALFVTRAQFEHPASSFLCGLPFRQRGGRLVWPRRGQGYYWSPELRSAQALSARLTLYTGWLYERQCSCGVNHWIRDRYAMRRRLGARGYVVKKEIASGYGKLAQRIGSAPFQNFIWAGLTTARTRSQLNEAIASTRDQRNAKMLATDGFVSKEPLDVELGDELGQWGLKNTWPGLFIVRPGFYWPLDERGSPLEGASFHTRGQPMKAVRDLRPAFQEAWRGYAAHGAPWLAPPSVMVKRKFFMTLTLAYHLGRLEQMGEWQLDDFEVTFAGAGEKRDPGAFDELALELPPLKGSVDDVSMTYDAGDEEQRRDRAGWEWTQLADDTLAELALEPFDMWGLA